MGGPWRQAREREFDPVLAGVLLHVKGGVYICYHVQKSESRMNE
jgi:hypothetical protein